MGAAPGFGNEDDSTSILLGIETGSFAFSVATITGAGVVPAGMFDLAAFSLDALLAANSPDALLAALAPDALLAAGNSIFI